MVTWLYDIKYITNVDKRQLFNYKIKCIKNTNHRKILPLNAPPVSIQHFKPSMP